MKFDDVRTVQFWPPFVPRAHPPYARLGSTGSGGAIRAGKGVGSRSLFTVQSHKEAILGCPEMTPCALPLQPRPASWRSLIG